MPPRPLQWVFAGRTASGDALDRLAIGNLGEAATLFKQCMHELLAAGYEKRNAGRMRMTVSTTASRYPTSRAPFISSEVNKRARSEIPFASQAAPASSAGSTSQPAGRMAPTGSPISWAEIHRRRPDLQQAFPDVFAGDRQAFLDWTTTHGREEYEIPHELTSVRFL